MISSPFFIRTSGFDAIDFTAGAILAGSGFQIRVEIDATDARTERKDIDPYDYRLAIPIPGKFSRSPDGQLRQEVIGVEKLLGYTDTRAYLETREADFFLSEPFFSKLTKLIQKAKYLVHSGSQPIAAFTKACYSELGVECQISVRSSRKLRSDLIWRLFELLRKEASYRGVSTINFRQGGSINVDGVRYNSVHFTKNDGLLFITGNKRAAETVKLSSVVCCDLSGPLDSIIMPTHEMLLGHNPWFLGVDEADNNCAQPKCVSIIPSLFRKHSGNSIQLAHENNFFLLDEYKPESYAQFVDSVGLGSDAWVFDAARELSSLEVGTDERWAWSQRSAGRLSQAAIARGEAYFTKHPYSRLLGRLIFLETLAKQYHTTENFDLSPIIETGMLVFQEIEYWTLFLQKVGLGRDYRGVANKNIDELERRFRRSIKRPNQKYLLDLRFFYKQVYLIATSAVIFVADTSCRASLPSLALTCSVNDFSSFLIDNKRLITERANHRQQLLCI